MTKADFVSQIAKQTGVDRVTVKSVVAASVEVIKSSLKDGENVYLRSFGSFITKKRAPKIARNIKKNVSIRIGEHTIPAFKPCRTFLREISGDEYVKQGAK